MKKLTFKNVFSSKLFNVIISVILAFLVWISVAVFESDDFYYIIEDVPLTIPQSAAYKSLGLDIVDGADVTVDVAVSGSRTVLGTLNTESVVVTPVLTPVNEAGEYTLAIQVTKASQLDSFTVKSASPTRVRLKFAYVTSAEFDIDVEVSGVSVPEDYLLQEAYATPETISVTGAESDVALIDHVVARAEINNRLTQTTVFSAAVALLDIDGNELDIERYKLNYTYCDITIPVLKEKEVPVVIGYTNVPEDIDTGILEYTLTHKTIVIAGPESVIDKYTELTVGYVSLSTISTDREYKFTVSLPNGFLNVNNVTEITAIFGGLTLEEKSINITAIEVINIPDGYDITIGDQRIYNVVIIGENIDAISANHVKAVVDASQLSLTAGRMNVPVTLRIPSHDNAWVKGDYTVVINVSVRQS